LVGSSVPVAVPAGHRCWLFVCLSANLFSLRELDFISGQRCSNVRSRLLVLLRSHGGVEELNRLFLDLVAVGQEPSLISVVLEHGAQVDTEESCALHMACDASGHAARWHRHESRRDRLFGLPAPSASGPDVMVPILRCLLDHGATPRAGLWGLSVDAISCLVEYGHTEALHNPDTFGNAVRHNDCAMIDFLMQHGADVDAGLRSASRYREKTLLPGLSTVLSNVSGPVTPLSDATIRSVCHRDSPAAAALLLHGVTTGIEAEERESIARHCLRDGYQLLAIQMVINDMVPIESDLAEEILVAAARSGGSDSASLMEHLGSLRFPKRALDHALARALEHAPISYKTAKELLQHGASLPAGYEEETAGSRNVRRAQFVREAMDMETGTARLIKAAR